MLETDNLKFVKWFESAKKIVNDNPDIPVVLSNADFVKYVNSKVPLPIKISKSYIDQILYYNPNTSTLPSRTEELFGEQFREWWNICRVEQQLKLYKYMKSDDKAWQREKFILERRFRDNWEEIKQETYNGPTEIKVTFSEDTSDEVDK